VFIAAGCPAECVGGIGWDVGGLHLVLRTAATQAGRDADALAGSVRERLLASAAELEELLAERRAEEALLVAQLLRDREALAAARLYADGGVAAGAFSDGEVMFGFSFGMSGLLRRQQRRVMQRATTASRRPDRCPREVGLHGIEQSAA
jgi:hypothetical protein